MKYRIFTFNQGCTRAGKVLTDSDMEAYHNYTFEGDDYPDDVYLHEGTAKEITTWSKAVLDADLGGATNSNILFHHKVAQNVLNALETEAHSPR